MEKVTSLKNPIVREFKSIKQSDRDDLFLIEGENMTRGVIESGLVPEIALYDEDRKGLSDMIEKLSSLGTRVICSNDMVVSSVSSTKTPQGIVCTVKKDGALFDIDRIDESVLSVIILENVSDPGNVGTVIRTAEALGTDLVISVGGAGVFNQKVLRSTVGAFFSQKIAVEKDIARVISALRERGFRIYASSLNEDSQKIEDADLLGKTAIVIGNESSGVTDGCVEMCDGSVMIPMKGKVQSLNASVAASVFMWEMSRRK